MDVLYKGYSLQMTDHQLYKIVLLGKGGSVPVELTGLYTNRASAMVAIDSYLAKKVDKNNETNTVRG